MQQNIIKKQEDEKDFTIENFSHITTIANINQIANGLENNEKKKFLYGFLITKIYNYYDTEKNNSIQKQKDIQQKIINTCTNTFNNIKKDIECQNINKNIGTIYKNILTYETYDFKNTHNQISLANIKEIVKRERFFLTAMFEILGLNDYHNIILQSNDDLDEQELLREHNPFAKTIHVIMSLTIIIIITAIILKIKQYINKNNIDINELKTSLNKLSTDINNILIQCWHTPTKGIILLALIQVIIKSVKEFSIQISFGQEKIESLLDSIHKPIFTFTNNNKYLTEKTCLMSNINEAGQNIKEGSIELKQAISNIDIAAQNLDKAIGAIRTAFKNLDKSICEINNSIHKKNIKNILNNIESSSKYINSTIKNASTDINKSTNNITKITEVIKYGLGCSLGLIPMFLFPTK
jgi:hypothetical protein